MQNRPRIYLDNAATSFPKAPGLGNTIGEYFENDCLNPNRTNSAGGFSLFDRMYTLREGIARMYNLKTPESVCFTSGITQSLNMIIKGLFTEKDHVLVSSCEHNSVMRPLVQQGIRFSRIPSTPDGYVLADKISGLIRRNTRAIIMNAAGNVSGAIQDIHEVARIAYKHGLLLFIDSAQATPYVDFDMENDHIAGIAFTGHKGLLGPEGTGGLALEKEIALSVSPLISGGTGSHSDSEQVPDTLPDRLEAGTQNISGILGLAHSFDYVSLHKEELRARERYATELLYNGIEEITGLRIVGPSLEKNRTSVISVVSDETDISKICALLSERYGIETRVGLHCSPSSHISLGTYPSGTLRFSPGPFTNADDIEKTLRALRTILNRQ